MRTCLFIHRFRETQAMRHDHHPPFARTPILVCLAMAFALGGCATREDVKREVDQYGDRVSGMETWFKSINQGIDTSTRRIQAVEDRLARLERQGEGLSAGLADTNRQLAGVAADLTVANQRLASLDGELAKQAASAGTRLDEVEGRLASASRRQEGFKAGLALAEGRITALEGRPLSMSAVPAAEVTVRAPEPAPAGPAATVSSPAAPAPAPVSVAAPLPGPGADAPAIQAQPAMAGPSAGPDLATGRLAALEEALAQASRQGEGQAASLSETRTRIADLQAQLAELRGRLDADAAAIHRLDGRLGQVDRTLADAHQRVEAGEKVLAESGLRLTLVQDLLKGQSERLSRSEIENDKVSATALEALERARQAGKLAEGKLLFEAALTDEVTHFGVQEADLNEAARKQLGEFAQKLKSENRGVFIEIQGHTDNLGSAAANLRLSRERAQAVRDYLHEQEGIPLHRLAVAAYGESKPVADNKTRDGRARNRRVMLVVLQ
ncbi:MAG: OmpA family protein [Pseudomonadota bacterium]